MSCSTIYEWVTAQKRGKQLLFLLCTEYNLGFVSLYNLCYSTCCVTKNYFTFAPTLAWCRNICNISNLCNESRITHRCVLAHTNKFHSYFPKYRPIDYMQSVNAISAYSENTFLSLRKRPPVHFG